MAKVDVDKLLDPAGDTMQGIVRGRRGAGRVEVAVLWPGIEKALDRDLSITAIWEALSKQGLVSIKLRGFTKAVKARREGVRSSRTAAKPAVDALASPAAGAARGSAEPDASAPARPDRPEVTETPPGRPLPAWRTGPHIPPDPNAVFKPRDR